MQSVPIYAFCLALPLSEAIIVDNLDEIIILIAGYSGSFDAWKYD